jgi:hypothetical protein
MVVGEKQWQLHRSLCANCLEYVGALASHNLIDFHGLLQGEFFKGEISLYLNKHYAMEA